jgi:hypothetical protein
MNRADVDRELEWIGRRGGDEWRRHYVIPFYMTWMGTGPTRGTALTQLADMRARAMELSADEIGAMLQMHWRVQVVATWFAIARTEPALAEAVHRGFERCYGTLTAPCFTTAVLTYPNDATADVLRRYRERSVAEHFGGEAIIDAGLRHLGVQPPLRNPSKEDEDLAQLMNVGLRLQKSA